MYKSYQKLSGIFLARLFGKQNKKPAHFRLCICRLPCANSDRQSTDWVNCLWFEYVGACRLVLETDRPRRRRIACACAWSHGSGFHDLDDSLQHAAIGHPSNSKAGIPSTFVSSRNTPPVSGYWFRVASSNPTRADVIYNSFMFLPPNVQDDTFFAETGIRSSN